MQRRTFIKTAAMLGGSITAADASLWAKGPYAPSEPWFDKAMRWAQLAFVENDPGNYDPEFWLAYFKRIHADGVLLSAGGVVAFYPTDIPLHYRSAWLNDSDTLGYLVEGCRKLGMTIVLRTDPHAVRDNVLEQHPDWIAVTADGEKRRHWANPALWITCALGPYNFEFMTKVNREIMERYQPEAIFSNRWAGHGICYCRHCQRNFGDFAGAALPKTSERLDATFRKYEDWRVTRLRELWSLWDRQIRESNPGSRFIPNGFPDKRITGKQADFFFADHQGRVGHVPPWVNGKHAKELRSTMGNKPVVGIFSVGIQQQQYRWKDSVQSAAELRVWISEGVANGLRPCFVKFGGAIIDRRWMATIEDLYRVYHRNEKYLRNRLALADVAVVYSEQTNRNYGRQPWQQQADDHANGMYHALVEARIPFEMVSDQLLDEAHIDRFKVLVLPNIAALSAQQCAQLKSYVKRGGGIVATFETSLYDEHGDARADFGLSEIFGVTTKGVVDGPLKNSYLTLRSDLESAHHRTILDGLTDVPRMINGTHRLNVTPLHDDFPSPITLVPSYPDLPMEDVFARVPETAIRELFLGDSEAGRVVYVPWDLDRSFWQLMNPEHGRLIGNIVNWAIGNDDVLLRSHGVGVLDIAVWEQAHSMTVHLVNLTNPMMMKGPLREIIPVTNQHVAVRVPEGREIAAVKLLVSQRPLEYEKDGNRISLVIDRVHEHEIIAIDFV